MTMKTIEKIVIRILRNSRNNLGMIKMILMRMMLTRIIPVKSIIMKRILINMTLVEITKIILKMIIELRGLYKVQMVISGILTERGLSGFAFRHACTATLYSLRSIWNHKIPSVYLRNMFSGSGSRIYLGM